jgi:hypothetical protein
MGGNNRFRVEHARGRSILRHNLQTSFGRPELVELEYILHVQAIRPRLFLRRPRWGDFGPNSCVTADPAYIRTADETGGMPLFFQRSEAVVCQVS